MRRIAFPSTASYSIVAVLLLLLVFPAATSAQRPGGSAADPTNAFEVTGPVISFTAAAGAGMPALTVEDSVFGPVDIGLGPVWFLRQAGFSAVTGDEVELLAYPCATCSLPAVAAWVNNRTTGVGVELRDADGVPLWRRSVGHPRCEPSRTAGPGTGNVRGGGLGDDGQPGNGPGPYGDPEGGPGPHGDPAGGLGPHGGQCDWNAPDMGAVATVAGAVVSVDAQPGEGMPAMLLATDGGELELLLSPYHPIAAAGFLIEPGMELIVTYARWLIAGEEFLATISITDPVTGLTIQLRDPETGFPVRGGHGYGPV